ncbi:winged helix-turn-helix transcriptional regulator [Streptomyces sp. NPDC001020]
MPTPAQTPKPSSGWTDPTCPVARTLDLVGDRWSLLIIRDAMDGASAFSDFHRRLGIARNILTDRLRRLVELGILAQDTAASGKRRIYVLTETGRDLFTLIVALRQWGERHTFSPGEAHSLLVDEHGRTVPPLLPRGEADEVLTSDTTRVEKV